MHVYLLMLLLKVAGYDLHKDVEALESQYAHHGRPVCRSPRQGPAISMSSERALRPK